MSQDYDDGKERTMQASPFHVASLNPAPYSGIRDSCEILQM